MIPKNLQIPILFYLLLVFSVNVGQTEGNSEVGTLLKDCENCPLMVMIPPGSFVMGAPISDSGSRDDERPQHQVNIAYSFAVGKFEVTRGEYAQFVEDTAHDDSGGCNRATASGIELIENLSWRDPSYLVTDNHPVTCVSWNEAKAYARWLSEQTGEDYRLLTESEWEYSARAGTTTIRYWGDSEEGCDFANGADLDITPESFLEEMQARETKIILPEHWSVANCHDGYVTSAPAGSFIPNAFGLYDTLGNVAEWVEDCWKNSYEDHPNDGSARKTGDCNRPILRGASYYDMPIYLRSSNHYGFNPKSSNNKDIRYINFGFRIARTIR